MADHQLRATGHRFALRPVDVDDAAFIIAVRTDPRAARFIHSTRPSLTGQEEWIRNYLTRPDDYFFVIEDLVTGVSEGTIGLYDVNVDGSAEMGRWVLKGGSMSASESALLAYRVAFETLQLGRVYCRTVGDNEHVVSFHRSAGLEETGPPESITLDGIQRDIVRQQLVRATWPEVGRRLEVGAVAAARLLARSPSS